MLGRGAYVVGIAERGGASLLPDVPWTGLEWGREGGDTSEASIEIGGTPDECRSVLGQARPWRHEVTLLRNGRQVWRGPIVTIGGGGGRTLACRDSSAWLDRRRAPRDRAWIGVDAGQIMAELVAEAMLADDSPGLEADWREVGIRATRRLRAAKHPIIGDEVRELGRSGVRWTTIGRTLRIRKALERQRDVPRLTDDDFAERPEPTIHGLLQANRPGVRGFADRLSESADDPVWGEAEDEASIQRDGLIESVVTEDTILDNPSAHAAAETRLALVRDAPILIEDALLAPGAPIDIDQLVPGLLLDVKLDRTFVPVVGRYRMTSLSVSAEPAGAERVALRLEPAVALGEA